MGRSMRREALAWTLFASVWTAGETAHGQSSPPRSTDVAAAQALFDEAKQLMDAKRFAEACPKLAESQRLDPGGGTTILLAMCHEGQGKIATAWADYNEALTDARRDRRPDRERVANEKIAELAPRLARMRIVASGNEPNLEIKRDGVVVGRAQWGTPLPVDPGDYVFEASAPGKKTWRGLAKIQGEGKIFDVVIPALEEAPAPVAETPPAPAAAPPSAAADHRAEPEKEAKSSDRLLVAGVVAGAGVVAVGVGAVLGLSAMSSWDSLKQSCPGGRCPNDALIHDGQSVRSRADASTLLFVLGGLGVATAVGIYVAWPQGETDPNARAALRVAPYASAHGGGLSIGGSL